MKKLSIFSKDLDDSPLILLKKVFENGFVSKILGNMKKEKGFFSENCFLTASEETGFVV